MSEEVQKTKKEPNALQRFLKRKNIIFSAKRYGIDALGAMAQGLFASLLIGTIIALPMTLSALAPPENASTTMSVPFAC